MSPTARCSFVGSAANSVLRVGLSLLKVLRVIDRRIAQSESVEQQKRTLEANRLAV